MVDHGDDLTCKAGFFGYCLPEVQLLNILSWCCHEVGSFQAAVLLPVNVCWQTGAMFGGFWCSVTGPEQGLAPNLVMKEAVSSFPPESQFGVRVSFGIWDQLCTCHRNTKDVPSPFIFSVVEANHHASSMPPD